MNSPSRSAAWMSTEMQLVCLCCRPVFTDADRQAIVELLGRVDLAAFARLAIDRHRVGPLVHAALQDLAPHVLPSECRALFAASARDNALQTLRAQRAHIKLATWFSEAGVDWMPFKGLVVAQRHYPRAELRHVNDIDVWVPTQQLERARQVLLSRGFRSLTGEPYDSLVRRGPRHRDFLAFYFHEEQYTHTELGTVELHWKLNSNPGLFTIPPETMRARGADVSFGAQTVRVMGDADLLLYLCEHGGRHGWGRLKWLVDLPRLLDSREWDWPQLFETARRAECLKTLALGLVLSRDLLGWQLPDPVQQELGRLHGLQLSESTVQYYLNAPVSPNAPSWREHATFVFMQTAKTALLTTSALPLVHHLRRYALSPGDLHVLRLPDRCFWMYYVARPFLFLIRRVRTSLGQAVG